MGRRDFDRKGYERHMGKCTGTRKYSNGKIGPCDHPSHGCFPADVLVGTPTGWRAMGDISAGDLVIAYSERLKRLVFRPVKRKIAYGMRNFSSIDFVDSNIRSLKVTATHSLLSESGVWVTVSNLRTGDRLKGLHEGPIEIEKITALEADEVFNLIVDDEFNFVVGAGVAAHSFTYARKLRVAVHRLISKFQKSPSAQGGVIALPSPT